MVLGPPGEAVEDIRRMNLSYSEEEALIKKVNQYAGESGVWVERFHKDYGREYSKVFVRNVGDSGLT